MPPFLRTLLETFIGLTLIAVIWVIAAFVVNDSVRLPNLPVVLSKVIELSENPDYLRHVVESVSALALGLPAALVVGIGVGLIAGLSPGLRWLLGPLVVVLAAAPMVVMMPVFIVWWGLLPATKAAAIFVVAAFPVMNMVMVATAAAHRPVHYVRRDRQPVPVRDPGRGMAAAIIGSLRLGVMLGVTGLVLSEFLASTRGVGYFIMNTASMFDTTGTMAGIVLIVVPTVLVVGLLQAIEEQVAR